MNSFAEDLNFESAARFRDHIKDLNIMFERCKYSPTSINNNNLILLLPDSKREKTINIILIKNGTLLEEKIIGIKSDLNQLFNTIKKNFYSDKNKLKLNDKIIEEIRIINTWLFKQKDKGEFLYVNDLLENDLLNQLKLKIRNFNNY